MASHYLRDSRAAWLAIAIFATGCASSAHVSTPHGTANETCPNLNRIEVVTNHRRYSRGQIVNITVTLTYEGPNCTAYAVPGCWEGASAYNSFGTDVWDSGAGPDDDQDATEKTCGPLPLSPVRVAHGSSRNDSFQWTQLRCSFPPFPPSDPPSNPDCPDTQVPSGVYKIVGDDNPAATALVVMTP
jgi:hypothetical protein